MVSLTSLESQADSGPDSLRETRDAGLYWASELGTGLALMSSEALL
jgi:hypothetical protein